MNTTPLKAVLFDLDDTLYDHRFAARSGLIALRERTPALQSLRIDDLEELYSEILEAVHLRLLRGELSQDEARILRNRQFFGRVNLELDDPQALAEYARYRRDYDDACRLVAGSRELLDELARRGLRLGIITNNLVSEQTAKLRQLDLHETFEVVTISEAFGVPKPAPEIFRGTLDELGVEAADAVMVGDSLTSDIAGALGVGLRSVWLDRRPELGREAPPGVPTLLGDFSDLGTTLQALFDARHTAG
ncbi:MAG: HAD family hydrolase [Acidobacteriota bacterium]